MTIHFRCRKDLSSEPWSCLQRKLQTLLTEAKGISARRLQESGYSETHINALTVTWDGQLSQLTSKQSVSALGYPAVSAHGASIDIHRIRLLVKPRWHTYVVAKAAREPLCPEWGMCPWLNDGGKAPASFTLTYGMKIDNIESYTGGADRASNVKRLLNAAAEAAFSGSDVRMRMRTHFTKHGIEYKGEVRGGNHLYSAYVYTDSSPSSGYGHAYIAAAEFNIRRIYLEKSSLWYGYYQNLAKLWREH